MSIYARRDISTGDWFATGQTYQQLMDDGVGSFNQGNPYARVDEGIHPEIKEAYTGPQSCGPIYPALPTLQGGDAFYAAGQTDAAACAASERRRLDAEIQAQVSNPSTRDAVQDPGIEADLIRQLAAATDKGLQLDKTADADLGDFDPILAIASPDDDAIAYSQFSVRVANLGEWSGAPGSGKIYGGEFILRIRSGSAGDGSSARVFIVDDPADRGGSNLPLTQDADDPTIWRGRSQLGSEWADPDGAATYHLLWGGGSLQISRDMICEGINGPRLAAPVRYGVLAAGRRHATGRRISLDVEPINVRGRR